MFRNRVVARPRKTRRVTPAILLDSHEKIAGVTSALASAGLPSIRCGRSSPVRMRRVLLTAFSYSLATDHLQKTVFHHVDVMRQLYPAWSPDTGVFPFSMTDSNPTADDLSASSSSSASAAARRTSYASSVDAGVRAMLVDDVSGESRRRCPPPMTSEGIAAAAAAMTSAGNRRC